MTPEQMDRLDRVLAEKLMKYEICEDKIPYGVWVRERPDQQWWFYSPTRSITQALGDGGPGTVVGEMKEQGWFYDVGLIDNPIIIKSHGEHVASFSGHNREIYRYASTPALAICLAADEVLEIEIEKGGG